MLGAPLLAQLQAGGGFAAVVASAGAAAGDQRLDTEIVRLQHDFRQLPSQVRFTLRATLIDERTRRVLAWREFDSVQGATSDDPASGVDAANRAVRGALQSLAQFCRETTATAWPGLPPDPDPTHACPACASITPPRSLTP